MIIVAEDFFAGKIRDILQQIDITHFSEDEIIEYITSRFSLDEVKGWYDVSRDKKALE